MWYKHFNKGSWAIRLWRTYNLKFKSNETGMGSNVYQHYFKILVLRIWRTEGSLRLFNVSTLLALGFIKIYFDGKNAAEAEHAKQENAAKNKQADLVDYLNTLQINRYGAPTQPGYSMNDFLYFIANNEAINDLGDINAVPEFQRVSSDLINGLDSWIGDEDRKLLAYYNAYQKNSHH